MNTEHTQITQTFIQTQQQQYYIYMITYQFNILRITAPKEIHQRSYNNNNDIVLKTQKIYRYVYARVMRAFFLIFHAVGTNFFTFEFVIRLEV